MTILEHEDPIVKAQELLVLPVAFPEMSPETQRAILDFQYFATTLELTDESGTDPSLST